MPEPSAQTIPPSAEVAAPAESAEDKSMREKLEKMDKTIPMTEFPVTGAFEFVGQVSGLKFAFSEKALKEIGDKGLVIGFRVQDVPMKNSLRDELGKIGLAYRIKNGAIEIITKDEASSGK